MKNFFKRNKDTLITLGIVTVAYIIIEIFVKSGSISSLFKGLLVPICSYIILAISLNLTVGILGELSLGHAGFMCIGAFTSAFFSKLTMGVITPDWFRFVLAILIGFVFAGIFGFLIGMPVLRLKGDYLAIVTLAFGEIIKNLMGVLYVGRDSRGLHLSIKDSLSLGLEEDGQVIINGAQGITGTPKDSTFTAGFILIIISLIIILNFIKSREGRAVMAIRDNVIAAESVGINVTRYKLLAFSLSAALAGVAGVLYSHNLNSLMATTKNFGYNMSIMILVFVVLGGIGSIRGSVISAVILTLLPELLRGLSTYRMLIYAIVLTAMMLFNWAPSARAFRARLLSKLPFRQKKALDKEV
ncbi:MAG: branched-chain amino acid ABC transporter permease [Lachnospiraceae bacterium]|nr:branched-chain amino acid ABC transporter permease [Lachnospiraceae bacterium]